MSHRYIPVFVLGWILMLAAAVPSAIAQTDSDSAALLSNGIARYEQGQTTEARQTLERIDPATLNADQRVQLQQTLEAIERQQQLLDDPGAMLVAAEAAEKRGDLAHAATLYEAIGKHVRSTDQQKLRAATNLATLRRRQNPDLSRVRAMIDQASADLNAGRLAEAERKIREVRQSDVDLGWFDNNRLDRLSVVLAEKKAATTAPPSHAAVASAAPGAAVGSPRPAAQGSDLMAQIRSLALQERLASARAAEQNGNYTAAARFYEEALAIEPDNAQIRQSLEAARAKGQTQVAPRGAVQQVTTAIQLHRQQVLAEYRELMNTAQKRYEARNFTSAREAVSQARVTLDQGQRALPGEEYKQLREQAVTLAASIDEAERQFQEAQREDIATQQEMEVAAVRNEAEEVTQREVQNMLRRAQELRREQKYDRALELIDQALFLDPQNFAAEAMKEMIEDSKLYVETRRYNRQHDYMTRTLSLQNEEAVLPYTELMNFPADWPQLTQRRLAGLDTNAGESEQNRRIEVQLQEPVPVNFENNSLVNVIDYLRNTTGLNIYVNWTALQNVGVEQDYPINLQLSNVPASQALALVLQEASAGNELDPIGYAIHQGIIKISTERELKRTTVSSRIFDIRDLLVRVPNFSNAPAFSLEDALGDSGSSGGSSGSSGGSSTSLFGGDDDDDDDDDDSGGQDDDDSGGSISREELIFQILDLVRQIGRPEEWVAFGGDISSVTELNGNLIVRTTPQNQQEVLGLLQSLRETRAMQINVEARFLLVDQNFLEEVGVDVDMRVADPGSRFGALTVTQDSFGVAARPNTGITGSFGQTLANAGVNGLDTFDIGSGTGSGRSLDLGVSYLDDIEVALLVRASQNSRRAVTVTAPRLTFFNGQRAYITVARQVSFVSALEAVPDSNFFNPTLSVTQSGVVLDVEGTVSADRRYVTMTIRPALATIIQIRRVEFFAQSNNTNDNNNNDNTTTLTQGFIEAPELELTELATTVSVPDKGTLLLGGQRLVGEVEVEAGVPVLSKMPFLNRLFTNRSKTKDERTLLILIKPTIIIQNEEEELNFPGLQQNPQAYNVGRQF